jgi:hypothetical protein
VPLILRAIQKSKWYKSPSVPWLPEGSLQADALKDLHTQGNVLSVYLIDDEKKGLERVAVALAATKDTVKEVDYALFDQSLLDKVSIKIKKTAGTTPDGEVNKWHLDLVELTADKIINLANIIMQDSVRARIQEKTVASLLRQALDSGHLRRDQMRSQILDSLARH